eukprot:4087972-Karenia_brevis.AAC.1
MARTGAYWLKIAAFGVRMNTVLSHLPAGGCCALHWLCLQLHPFTLSQRWLQLCPLLVLPLWAWMLADCM